MSFRTSPVNNTGVKSVNILLDPKLFAALEKIAKQQNKNKREIVLPLIEKFVEENRVA